jgi:hypothetical protein
MVKRIRLYYPWDDKPNNFGYIVLDADGNKVTEEVFTQEWGAIREANRIFKSSTSTPS